MDRKLLTLLALLVLLLPISALSFSANWPACLPFYTLQSGSTSLGFATTTYGQQLSCSTLNEWFFGMNLQPTNPVTGSIAGGVNSTHFKFTNGGATATNLFSYPLPASGNYTAVSDANGIMTLTVNGSPTLTLYPSLTLNFTDANATSYNLTNGSMTIDILKTAVFNISIGWLGGPTGTVYFPVYLLSTVSAGQPKELSITPDSTPTANTFGPNEFYMSLWNSTNGAPSGGTIVRSNFSSGLGLATLTNTFQANLYYQTQAIYPLITYFPGIDAYGRYFNATNGAAYLRNNTNAYVLDSVTQQWYLVPAVQAANFQNVLLISVVLANGGSGGAPVSPYIPNYLSCHQVGDQYIVNASWPAPVSNLLTFQNSTVVNNTANTSASFYASINTTVDPIISYQVNLNTTCARSNSSTIFPFLGQFNTVGLGAGRYIGDILMALSIGISVVQPFALLFPVGLNDMFGFITPLQMGLVATLVITISIIINGFERVNTVKSIIVYTLVLCGIMTQVYLNAGLDSSPFQAVGASFANLTTNNPTLSPWNFLSNAFGFIIDIFLLVLTLPAIAINAVTGPTCQYIPVMCGPAVSIGLMVTLGLVAWLWLKSYEVETNKFRDV